MEQKKKSAKRFLVIAIAIMLVSMIGASLVQTSGGRVTIKDIRFETSTGYQMSGLLLVPKGVSAENPAPAVIASHGYYNNREMQDANYVELARRGYVVFSMDLPTHGNSENTKDTMGDITLGMYEAVKMIGSLNYVDSSKIGVTGHSLGGTACDVSVQLDNAAPLPLISAVLMNCAPGTYMDESGNYTNIYGNRDVGILFAANEELLVTDEMGLLSVDPNAIKVPGAYYWKSTCAQSFLYFGIDPVGQELRSAETIYTENIDGKEAIRTIYQPSVTHPSSHFSKQSTIDTIEFFEMTLGGQNPIAASNQIWQWKELFNCLGLVGVAMFLMNFAILMVYTPFFSSLRANEVVAPIPLQKEGKIWFWCSLAATALFGVLIFSPLCKALDGVEGYGYNLALIPQTSPFVIGMWAMLCGLFSILCMVLFYIFHGKKNGFRLAGRGVTMPFKKIGKTVLLALIVVTVAYGWVFFADYFFKTDFRIWVLAMKAFEADKLLVSILPAILFLVFYIANSVAINSFNYNDIGKKSWINTLITTLFTVAPAIILLFIQYSALQTTDFFLFRSTFMERISTVWLYPFLVILPATTVLSRKIYRITNNPYLPGIINALIITLISCTNTATWL